MNPRPYLDQLTVSVALRQVIALAHVASALTDDLLRDRLVVLGRLARAAMVPVAGCR